MTQEDGWVQSTGNGWEGDSDGKETVWRYRETIKRPHINTAVDPATI
jgi:hypothetical protein